MELLRDKKEPKAHSNIEVHRSAHRHEHLESVVDFVQYALRKSKYDHYHKGVRKQYAAVVQKWIPFVLCYLAGLFTPPRKQTRH